MIETLAIEPCGPVDGSVRPPGSKSLTNRALVCASLAQGTSALVGALDSEDTRVMIVGLRTLGVVIEHDVAAATIRVAGCGGRFPSASANLYLANSGTSIRFLTAAVTLGHGTFRLDGSPRMRQRPIEDLLVALRQLGVDAQTESETGCPPVIVNAAGLHGGRAEISGTISSQFVSGILMAAPCAVEPVELAVRGELVSKPYVDMTLAVMQSFGANAQNNGYARFVIPGQQVYQGCHYEVEPDASAASYFFAAAAITGGRVTVEGLSRRSLQGDVAFSDCLAQMGCNVQYGDHSITVQRDGGLHGIEVDMNAISDTAQTLAVVALFAQGSTQITGVGHIRHKETDRIGDLARELRKLGAAVKELPDGLSIEPRQLRPAELDTYDDHRMAMSLALAGLGTPGVVIRDPGCTRKTYPGFFEDLARLVGTTQPTIERNPSGPPRAAPSR